MSDHISVVTVAFNPGLEIVQCIKSLNEHISCEHEIIVVDNSPAETEAIRLLKLEPNVQVIKSGSNLGYGKAINLGVEHSKYENILIINPDAYLLSDPKDVVKHMDDSCGVCSGVCLDEMGAYKKTVGFFPRNPFRLFFFSKRLNSSPPFGSGDFSKLYYDIDYAEGSLYLIKKSLFRIVGGFDSNIFLYGEDYEFCYRVKLEGKRNMYFKDLRYVHFGGYSHAREPHIVQGLLYFSKKHLNRFYSVSFRVALVVRYMMIISLAIIKSADKNQRARLKYLYKSLVKAVY